MADDVRPSKDVLDSDLEELCKKVTAFCADAGYQLSPESEAIFRDMVNMKKLTGQYYCPCQTRRIEENVCVCQAVRNGLVDLMGACFCNLILINESK